MAISQSDFHVALNWRKRRSHEIDDGILRSLAQKSFDQINGVNYDRLDMVWKEFSAQLEETNAATDEVMEKATAMEFANKLGFRSYTVSNLLIDACHKNKVPVL